MSDFVLDPDNSDVLNARILVMEVMDLYTGRNYSFQFWYGTIMNKFKATSIFF